MCLKSEIVNGHVLGQAKSSRRFLLLPVDDDEDWRDMVEEEATWVNPRLRPTLKPSPRTKILAISQMTVHRPWLLLVSKVCFGVGLKVGLFSAHTLNMVYKNHLKLETSTVFNFSLNSDLWLVLFCLLIFK